ncbi:hypothetical protein [Sphingobacterium sp. BIGb0165]|uniref:hypothetical protein n=1 Tax=Sphingobacterium sp. BIGb0165 TaxID=2940615 RepID=UPI0021690ED3|nr:hypothetical protein [Sphingobacterium sp. BIGb0165]MCS4225523.1 hypothetical protein [Sphingobacterium sp. BIGb0165]
MNKLFFIRALLLRTSTYICCLFVSLSTLLLPQETWAASPDQLQQQPFSPYSISDDGYLHYNLQVNDSSYLAIALNLHTLFPGTNVENLRLKQYELTDSELKISSYQGVPVSASYQIIDNKIKLLTTKNWPSKLTLNNHLFSLSFIEELTALFAANDLEQLKLLNWGTIPKENILLFLSQLNDFSNTAEFGYNAIHNMLANKNYAVAKFFYNSFLTKNKNFNDFELLKMAIEQDDLDFIKKTSLNSLNIWGIDEVKFDYSFTQCTLLGKAIQQKNKVIARYLLDHGASTEKVYKCETEVLNAIQFAEQMKAKKLSDLFK